MAVQIPSTTIKWNDLFSQVGIRMDGEYTDQVLKISPTFAKLYGSADKSSGLPEIITKRVRYTHGSFQILKGLSDINMSVDPQDTVAQYGRATYVGEVVIPVDELSLRQSPESLVNYMAEQYDDSLESGKDQFGKSIWSGSLSTTRGLHGLSSIIKATGSTTGTYAGLNRSTNSWWRNIAISNAAGINFTSYDVNKAIVTASFGASGITYMAGNTAVYNQAYAIADSKQKTPNDWAAKLGFTSINFNEIPFTLDRYAPTDRLTMLNEKFMKMLVDKNYDFKATPWIYMPNKAGMVKQIFLFFQVICWSLRHQVSLYNLK